MKKEPRLKYRSNRKKPHIVRFYDESSKRLEKGYCNKIDATNRMMEQTGEVIQNENELTAIERHIMVGIKIECAKRNTSLEEMGPSFLQVVKKQAR